VLQVVELVKFDEVAEIPEVVEAEVTVTVVEVAKAVELELVVSSSRTQI
jgi:hypothetical protein